MQGNARDIICNNIITINHCYTSGTVLAKNNFSVYCLQAFRLHKNECQYNSPIPGQAVKPPAPLFLQGQGSSLRPSPCPPFFRFQIDLLELVKGNIKLNLYLIVPLDTDGLTILDKGIIIKQLKIQGQPTQKRRHWRQWAAFLRGGYGR